MEIINIESNDIGGNKMVDIYYSTNTNYKCDCGGEFIKQPNLLLSYPPKELYICNNCEKQMTKDVV